MTEGDERGPAQAGTWSSEGSVQPARLRVIPGEGRRYGPPEAADDELEVVELAPGVWSIG